jgi:Spy/CpxP family protein refolding chaperone
MRILMRIALLVAFVTTLASVAAAQPPDRKPAHEPAKEKAKDFSNSPVVAKMMAFNKKKDGKLTKDEVTDERLHRLFDMADANKDCVVTKEEFIALAAKLDEEYGRGGGLDGPGGRGPGGPGGGGPGGPSGGPGGGGPGGPGGPPQPGQVMPPFLQDSLKLTADQKKQIEELQKDVDGKLAKILTDDQKKQLKEMLDRGPGGFGPPPGGPGGRGPGGRGPGGPPDRPSER